MARTKNEFQTVRSEGGLLPPDLLRRVSDAKGTLPGSRLTDYGLLEADRLNEVITQSWTRLKRYWADFRVAVRNLPEGEPATALTNDKWNLPLLRELGFGVLPASAGPVIEEKTYPINRFFGATAIHLIGCGLSLDRRATGVRGATTNPHGLVQEFLNRSTNHLWGIVSNGLRFRILRDNQALSRQSYLEFDLDAMFAGDVFPDFVLLWLTVHATRFLPQTENKPETCWLEQWTKVAAEDGTRALGDLKAGVEKSLQILGEAFVSHPHNTALREALRSGDLPLANLHGQLLRIVYRLIFLFVAEDRTMEGESLLHPREMTPEAATARERYATHYSTNRLRHLASKIKGSRHGDLWNQFGLLIGALCGEDRFEAVRQHLALPVLGSFLWNPESTANLNAASLGISNPVELTNADFLEALRHLAFTRQGKVLRPVDYKNLGSEELGGVYETLLALTPQISGDGKRFTFAEFAGNDRKTSGSYYTPDSLVQFLLDTALEPVVQDAVRGRNGAEAERAILDLKVCDPAVGSGHFLVGAAHRLARHLARIRANAQGESEPSPLLYQHALRDVIGRCLYGVDINPMSAELCRVSLWLEALEPGRPLSFLDHHIRVGNSLIGTTPELIIGGIPDEAFKPLEGDDSTACSALKRLNARERRGFGGLFQRQDEEAQLQLLQAATSLEELPDDNPTQVREKSEAFARSKQAPEYLKKKRIADTWCTAFVQRKVMRAGTTEPVGVTQRFISDIADDHPLPEHIETLVTDHLKHDQFFHWHLEFPEVHSCGGFDLMLGNPPWDTLSPDAKEFFSTYDPQVRFQDRDGQKKIIESLLQDPVIAARWEENCRDLYALVHFIKQSGRFRMFAPGNLGKGDFNVYRMFVEAALSLTRRGGWAAQLVPEGLYNGANCMAIRQALYETCRLDCLYGFENANEVWFKDVDSRTKFCLYAAPVGDTTDTFRAAFNIRSISGLADVKSGRYLSIPVRLVREFSPDALAIMELGNQMDIDIAARMYRWPAFGDETAGPPRRVYMREIDMGTDRALFDEDPSGIPLYEGRMVSQFDHRAKGYRSGRGRAAVWEDLPFGNADKCVSPQWYVARERVPEKCIERMGQFRIGFCDVASPTNERTLVSSLIPRGVLCGHKVPTIRFTDDEFDWYMLFWIAVANSYSMDFIARKKTSLSMAYTILDSFPFPRLDHDDPRVRELVVRSLRLSCTGPEMIPFWNQLATDGWVTATDDPNQIPGEPNEDARLQIRAEIDAIVARDLFDLTRPELEYILSTFPTQQRYQEEQYGEFRSRRMILDAFVALPRFSAATTTGVPS
ncbi:MAG: N-6 DNA methylase [Planctomyces sp.]|nr:N-6 DNA methylase [Planctomyces sp.]